MAETERSPRPAAAVPFVFGVADRMSLPGTALVRLLTDVGISESAARSSLARLREDGALRSVRHGRRTDYELAGLVEAAFLRARATGHPELGQPDAAASWSGEFHGLLFAIPETERPHRDRLRHAARLAGYAPLRPGLMIATADGWPALAEIVADTPDGATICPLVLRLAPADARTAALQAWNLARVAVNAEALIGRLHAAVDDDPASPSGPDALRRYTELAMPAYRFFIGIPQLPAELLPPDWPFDRLVAALAAVRTYVGLAAERYVADVVADA
ncbi:hypothetical protein [Microlunatus ginsengisoli]|uniref:PaaX family transcriptional regulator n=1 Tax=Microlunatus ginsengisoli TaxID=363863 RepID=A0ABP7AFA0_9ACTN